jgi:hypothetical protein
MPAATAATASTLGPAARPTPSARRTVTHHPSLVESKGSESHQSGADEAVQLVEECGSNSDSENLPEAGVYWVRVGAYMSKPLGFN